MCSLQLMDPSIHSSMKVNCFMKDVQLLPKAHAGDIVVLHNVKVMRIPSSNNRFKF